MGTVGDTRGWLRLGLFAKESEVERSDDTPDWDISLPLLLKFAWLKFLIATVVAGMLLSAPGIIGILLQEKPSPGTKLVLSVLAAIAGVLAAFVGRLGIGKGF